MSQLSDPPEPHIGISGTPPPLPPPPPPPPPPTPTATPLLPPGARAVVDGVAVYGRMSSAWMGFDPMRPPPRWGIPDAFVVLFVFIAGGFVALPVALITPNRGVWAIAGLLGSWALSLAYLLFQSRRNGQGTLALDFGLRIKLIDVPIGFATAIATMLLSLVVRVVIASVFEAKAISNVKDTFGENPQGAVVVVLALMAAFGAPFFEELVFRGLIFRAFARRTGTAVGVIVSGSIFGLLHWPAGPDISFGDAFSLVAGLIIYGVVFAVVVRYVGRLGPAILAHLMLNSLAAAVAVSQFFWGTGIT